MAVTAKQRNRDRLLRYLSDPDNVLLDRKSLATTVLGYKHSQSIWTVFTGTELDEIEREALDNRRKRYASWLARVDMGLLKAAAEGNPTAAKLVYQKFEGWTEKSQIRLGGDLDLQLLSDEEVERRYGEVKAEIRAEMSGDARCTQVSR